uniref:Uncharacterized protein n=1 Tax=Gibberella zeae TaxID=5518 RepID=A0A4E9DBX5_GIBZA
MARSKSKSIHERRATIAYNHAHGATPYTTLPMIARILEAAEEFVRRPKVIACIPSDRFVHFATANEDAMSHTGTCTIVALYAKAYMSEHHPNVYDIRLYDVGHHKIGRCLKTFVVIDSSSRVGVFTIPPGQPWTRYDNTFVWHADGSGSVTANNGQVLYRPLGITEQAADV